MANDEIFNTRVIELIGFLKGLNYNKDDAYINNFCAAMS